jgi:hypothetical protein
MLIARDYRLIQATQLLKWAGAVGEGVQSAGWPFRAMKPPNLRSNAETMARSDVER